MRTTRRLGLWLTLGLGAAACTQPAAPPSPDAGAARDSVPTADDRPADATTDAPAQEIGSEGGGSGMDASDDLPATVDATPDAAPDASVPPTRVSWARGFGGSGDERLVALAVAPDGNVYVAGTFTQAFSFGGVPLTSPFVGTGRETMFVAGLSPSGAVRWAHVITTNVAIDAHVGLAADAAGHVALAGTAPLAGSRGATDFGCGPETTGVSAATAFVVSLDHDGACRWSRRADGDGSVATAMAADAAGNLYVAGRFNTTFSLAGAPHSAPGASLHNGFLASLGPDGAPRWSRAFSASGRFEPTSVAARPSGGVTVAGYTAGSVPATSANLDFDGVSRASLPGGGFWATYDGDGTYLRARVSGAAAAVSDGHVAVGADGELLVGLSLTLGDAPDATLFDTLTLGAPRSPLALAVGFSPTGALRFGTIQADSSPPSAFAAFTATGERALAGTFTASLRSGAGATTVTSLGGGDVFVRTLDASGGPAATRVFGGPGDDVVTALASAPDGTLYVGGSFTGAADFGEALTATGGADLFVARVGDTCSGGRPVCDGRCTDTQTSHDHCGACGHACTTALACVDGLCAMPCPVGRSGCVNASAAVCVDLAADLAHCGACFHACAAGFACTGGLCACPSGQTDCGGRCVDLATDVAHCGACGVGCAGSLARCVGGACGSGCAAGRANCNDDPADGCETSVDVDVRRCGACGHACAAGEGCVAGACVAGGRAAFAPTEDVVLSAGAHEFASVDVPAGVTVRTDGTGVLDLRVAGAVSVAGVFDLSGADGRAPTPCTGSADDGYRCRGGRGGATGTNALTGDPAGEGAGEGGGVTSETDGMDLFADRGLGGAGAAGGGGGGGEGAPPGIMGDAGAGAFGGRGGGCASGTMFATEALAMCGAAGGGRASVVGYAGVDGPTTTFTMHSFFPPWVDWYYDAMSAGGGSIGDAAARDLPMATTFQPGSGGGGGGGARALRAGGGGGGGGGALRLVSQAQLTLASTARVYANGGAGGGTGPTARGGGGSGGAIYLGAPTVVARGGAVVSAVGGVGGGSGRIRLSVGASCTLDGTFTPSLASGCARSTPPGAPLRVYVGAWPD